MKLKLGIYFIPDTLHMIEITDIQSPFTHYIEILISVNGGYYRGDFSTSDIIKDFIYLGEV